MTFHLVLIDEVYFHTPKIIVFILLVIRIVFIIKMKIAHTCSSVIPITIFMAAKKNIYGENTIIQLPNGGYRLPTGKCGLPCE
jgi:hypothetical protein